ncbi:MAG: hypothetical protein QW753_06890, partial [Thermofilum sp.]
MSWYRIDMPARVEDLEGLAAIFTAPIITAPLVLWNEGAGLRALLLDPATAEWLRAEGLDVRPAPAPEPLPAEPFVCEPTALGTIRELRFAAALVVPKRVEKLVAKLEKGLLLRRIPETRALVGWVESVRRSNYTAFQAYIVKLRSGDNDKPARKLLEMRKPHRRSVLLAPNGLAALLEGLSWARFVNPVAREEMERGACVVALSAVREAPGRLVPVLRVGMRERTNNSITLVGEPGTGKSMLLRFLTWQLHRFRYPENVIIFDFSGEYSFLERYGFQRRRACVDFFINPLSLGPRLTAEVIQEVVAGVWGDRMTPIQVEDVLFPALLKSHTLFDAYRLIVEMERSAVREDLRTAAAAVLRRLRGILTPALAAQGELPRGRVVIDLTPIEGEAGKVALVLTALQWIYLDPRPVLVVIDDASKLGPECSILDRVVMHLRKHDVHVWAAVQEPELAPRALLQAAHLLFFRSRSRLAQQLSAPANPAALHSLEFVYEGRAYPVYAMPAELTGPREVAKPIPFSKVAAERNVDPIDLMEAYVQTL